MNKRDILQKLEVLKPILDKFGITILGIFSCDAESSSIELLYEMKQSSDTVEMNDEFRVRPMILEIKRILSEEFGKSVNLVNKSSLD